MDWLNSLLLPLYDLTGNPTNAFYAGTFLLALITAALGEVTIAFLYMANQRIFGHHTHPRNELPAYPHTTP